MQVKQLNEQLYKFTLSLNTYDVNVIASIGRDGILLVDTGLGGGDRRGAVAAKTVTYDFERLMDDTTLLKCSEFGDAIIEHMDN